MDDSSIERAVHNAFVSAYETCTHRCPSVTVEWGDDPEELTGQSFLVRCVALELAERFPGRFRIVVPT